MKLFRSKKIEIRKSKIHGWGVFANDHISKGELLEECPFIYTHHRGDENLQRYKYVYPAYSKGVPVDEWFMDIKFQAVCLGYGSLYNNSEKKEKATVGYQWDKERVLMLFKAIKEIKPNEEILLYYNSNDFDLENDLKDCNCIGEI